jgi:hypothetical protein
MNDANLTIDAATQAEVDRLVAGELPEEQRRRLLAWLDGQPGRWRFCALAFLEAQTWEAAANWQSQTTAIENAQPKQRVMERQAAVTTARLRHVSGLALAGAIALVFVTGVFSGRFWSSFEESAIHEPAVQPDETSPQGKPAPLLATVSVRTNLDPQVSAQLQVPVAPVDDATVPAPAFSEYERMQWERRGFELNEEQRYLPARLPDGSDVFVPVNKVRLRLKGTPVS